MKSPTGGESLLELVISQLLPHNQYVQDQLNRLIQQRTAILNKSWYQRWCSFRFDNKQHKGQVEEYKKAQAEQLCIYKTTLTTIELWQPYGIAEGNIKLEMCLFTTRNINSLLQSSELPIVPKYVSVEHHMEVHLSKLEADFIHRLDQVDTTSENKELIKRLFHRGGVV